MKEEYKSMLVWGSIIVGSLTFWGLVIWGVVEVLT